MAHSICLTVWQTLISYFLLRSTWLWCTYFVLVSCTWFRGRSNVLWHNRETSATESLPFNDISWGVLLNVIAENYIVVFFPPLSDSAQSLTCLLESTLAANQRGAGIGTFITKWFCGHHESYRHQGIQHTQTLSQLQSACWPKIVQSQCWQWCIVWHWDTNVRKKKSLKSQYSEALLRQQAL